MPKSSETLERRRDLLAQLVYFTLETAECPRNFTIPVILEIIFEETFSCSEDFIGIQFIIAQLLENGASFDRCLKLAKDVIWLLQFHFVM